MNLNHLGWDSIFADSFVRHSAKEQVAGRVIAAHRNRYTAATGAGDLQCEVSGRFRHHVTGAQDFPAVGDWVVLDVQEAVGIVQAVLPRRSQFSRRDPGGGEQVIAANVDTVFLVSGLDHDFNPRRIERYLVLAWESGANPVIVLNKTDRCANLAACLGAVENVAVGVPVVALSAGEGVGLEGLAPWLVPGRTVALLGSSGVGKSTIANRLVGEARQMVQAVREDDSRGRHTTTHRELILLPAGGLLMDTPGMREVQLWAGEESLQTAFEDVESLARGCRFRDCGHGGEPGCAVRNAIEEGRLEVGRLTAYRKLLRELGYLERREDPRAALAEKERWKKIHKAIRGAKG